MAVAGRVGGWAGARLPSRCRLAASLGIGHACPGPSSTVTVDGPPSAPCIAAQVLEAQACQAQRAHPLVRLAGMSWRGQGSPRLTQSMPPARPDRASHLNQLRRPPPAPQLGQLQVEPAQVAGALLRPVSLLRRLLLPHRLLRTVPAEPAALLRAVMHPCACGNSPHPVAPAAAPPTSHAAQPSFA